MDQLDEAESEKEKTVRDGIPAQKSPVEIAIGKLVHRIRDIEDCVQFVGLALKQQKEEATSLAGELSSLLGVMIASSVGSAKHALEEQDGALMNRIIDGIGRQARLRQAEPARTLLTSLFLGAFSAYDAYMGDLLRAIFTARPELFNRINGQVSSSQVMSARSIDEIKSAILDLYIDKLRRESYVEQLDELEKVFDMTLRKLPRWGEFVETAQRRNLMAHCDGVVSEQYLRMCKAESGPVEKGLKSGQRLGIGTDYLLRSTRLVMEVAIKLGHVLWRKVLPESIETADEHLHTLAYEALQLQEWDWTATLGEFALNQRNTYSELTKRVFVVNYAIALRYKDGREAGQRVMKEYDWSSCCGELRLANEVLNDRHEGASIVMREMGKRGIFLVKVSYHAWPLFRDFRATPQFLAAYREIYGCEFVTELQKEAAQAETADTNKGSSEAVVVSAGTA